MTRRELEEKLVSLTEREAMTRRLTLELRTALQQPENRARLAFIRACLGEAANHMDNAHTLLTEAEDCLKNPGTS